jgi:uncharacterized membrane protein YfcA
MNTSNLKDTISNIGAIVIVIAGAVNAYIQAQTGPINWFQLAVVVVVAVIGVLTGKTPAGTTKTDSQVVAQNVTAPVPPVSK